MEGVFTELVKLTIKKAQLLVSKKKRKKKAQLLIARYVESRVEWMRVRCDFWIKLDRFGFLPDRFLAITGTEYSDSGSVFKFLILISVQFYTIRFLTVLVLVSDLFGFLLTPNRKHSCWSLALLLDVSSNGREHNCIAASEKFKCQFRT